MSAAIVLFPEHRPNQQADHHDQRRGTIGRPIPHTSAKQIPVKPALHGHLDTQESCDDQPCPITVIMPGCDPAKDGAKGDRKDYCHRSNAHQRPQNQPIDWPYFCKKCANRYQKKPIPPIIYNPIEEGKEHKGSDRSGLPDDQQNYLPCTSHSRLLDRVAYSYYNRACRANSRRGIGTPVIRARYRARQPSWRGFLWSGASRPSSEGPLALSGSSNRGASGHPDWNPRPVALIGANRL